VELPLALFLQAAAPRDTLARLLHNLKEIHRTAQDWPRLLGVMDRLVILLPDRWEERRDRGLALLELGRHDGAAEDLSAYLAHRGDAPDAPAVGRHLARLRRPDGRQLH
jgi:regulator of sirC expression with transglutaminase-like and TPR domain